jgi:hypothetical protein
MGMISCLKVGYIAEILRCLLAICDELALYEEAVAALRACWFIRQKATKQR